MKRITALILVLLLVPFATFAADGDSPYYGKWAGLEHHAIMSYSAILHYIKIDKYGQSTYMVAKTHENIGKSVDGADIEMYCSQWKEGEEGIIIPTSKLTYVELILDDEGCLVCKDPKVKYVKLP